MDEEKKEKKMPRLTDVDVFLKKLEWLDEYDYIVFDAVKRTADEVPTVDAEPVRHGHWIRNDNGTYSCSECHSWIPDEQHYYARYCLFCGAKMDEVERERKEKAEIHGRWLKQGDEYRCSECGDTTIVAYKCCPNCSAKMDEVEDERI